MSLSYFTIFNPSLGPDEESLPKQLLFYTSAIVSDLDSQLRNIGLVQGIIELGRSFSDDTRSVDYIKSKQTCSYLLELEEGYWCALCLDLITEEGAFVKEIPLSKQVIQQLRLAYNLFSLEHGKFHDLYEADYEHALKVIEVWWMRWAWTWVADSADAILLLPGYRQFTKKLPDEVQHELDTFRKRLSETYSESFYDLLILEENSYLDSGTGLSSESKQALQHYVKHLPYPIDSPKYIATSNEPQDGPRTVVTDEIQDASWWTSQKWSSETSRLINAVSSYSKSRRAPAADSCRDATKVVQPTWQFPEDKLLRLYLGSTSCSTLMYVNVLRHDTLALVSVLSVPGARERALVREHIEANSSHLMMSLAQHVSANNTGSHFFSLLSDNTTGSIFSTLPDLSLALKASTEDTPIQAAVKLNTKHLHRQIYLLAGQTTTQSCVKTSKNIWIFMYRDFKGIVVLAKSSKAGETMEEVEKEGTLWISSLRSKYSIA